MRNCRVRLARRRAGLVMGEGKMMFPIWPYQDPVGAVADGGHHHPVGLGRHGEVLLRHLRGDGPVVGAQQGGAGRDPQTAARLVGRDVGRAGVEEGGGEGGVGIRRVLRPHIDEGGRGAEAVSTLLGAVGVADPIGDSGRQYVFSSCLSRSTRLNNG
jgi:hypothetical protein